MKFFGIIIKRPDFTTSLILTEALIWPAGALLKLAIIPMTPVSIIC